MRLLLVTTDFPPKLGGTQTYAHQLASRMCFKCDAFAVVAPFSRNCRKTDETLPFPVYRIRGGPDLFPIAAAHMIARLGKVFGYEAVFCVSWQSGVATRIARVFGGPRVTLMAAHGRELLFNPFRHLPLLGGAYQSLRRFSFRGSSQVFPVSRYTKELLIQSGIDERRIRVLGNGTDPGQYFPEDVSAFRKQHGATGRPVLLSVGRLVHRKGIDVMLTALPGVLKQVPNALYVIIGDGPERKRLQALCDRLLLTDSVRFVSEKQPHELRNWFNLCDLFVLPTRELAADVEGFGLVFLEAAACSKPAIGTRSGGVPDAVVDGETGLLVPSETPEKLSEAVVRILCSSDLADRMGKAGRRRVLNSANWDTVASTLFTYIRCSLAESRIDQDAARSSALPFSFFRF